VIISGHIENDHVTISEIKHEIFIEVLHDHVTTAMLDGRE
jgi:hypothetical protein